MSYVRNREQLLSHGEQELRRHAVDLIEHALMRADPYVQTKKLVRLEGERLWVGEESFSLAGRRIYVLGAGKASYPIARALEEILGERLAEGYIVCKYGQEGELKRIRLQLAAHPVPDEKSVEGAVCIMKVASAAQAGDLVFCAFTGGSTSLAAMPLPGISLEDMRLTYKLLLRSSANIMEMNMVRKHICQIKGGRLARMIHPEAQIVNITVSDVIGDPLDYITCPTVPDTSSLEDARRTISRYGLWDLLPRSVSDFLREAGEAEETPKDLSDRRIISYIAVPGDAACEGARERARELGYNAMILSTMLEGESREVGATFAAIGKEALLSGRPLPRPCAVIGGGETTMKIAITDPGEGGPNQQFALAAATWLDGLRGIVVAGLDTDGTDGISDLAGGLVDGMTMETARQRGVDVDAAIARYSDSPALRELDDCILTGATGTNVNDLKFLLVR